MTIFLETSDELKKITGKFLQKLHHHVDIKGRWKTRFWGEKIISENQKILIKISLCY